MIDEGTHDKLVEKRRTRHEVCSRGYPGFSDRFSREADAGY